MPRMTARQWRRPSLFAIVLTVVGVLIFARLGIWQLDRAAEAQRILDAFAAAPNAPYEEFSRVRSAPPDARYPHVRVRGHFVAERGYLRDEQVRNGRLGVEAFAVFAVASDDALLLVDRGWIAWSRERGTQPALPALAAGEVELSGVYAPFPGSGLRVGGNALSTQSAWPKLTLAIDAQEIGADLKQALLPRVLLLDADASAGLLREWTPNLMSPQRHQAYAFQWFAFVLAAIVIFVLLHYKKVDK
jgi:cytochrome oxidase assembly protein ShyY1